MGTDNIIFHCHYMPSPCEDGVSLRVTIKPKALFKPFGKTVIEPFLKAVNAKLPEAERVGVEDFERFMVGPGTRMSDTVSDLSVTVQSVLPTDTEDQDEDQAGIVRVDLMPRTTRDVTLIYRHIGFEASLPAQHVHARSRKLPPPGRIDEEGATRDGLHTTPIYAHTFVRKRRSHNKTSRYTSQETIGTP